MKCRLTGIEAPLVKAHIIPQSFYALRRDQQNSFLLLQSEVQHYPKRAPIGIYDQTILSLEAERLFSDVDDHACEVLIKGIPNRTPINESPSPLGFTLAGCDYRKMKLFFVSLLWRAS